MIEKLTRERGCVMFDDVVMMDDMYLKEGQKLGREHAMEKERERMMKTR